MIERLCFVPFALADLGLLATLAAILLAELR